MEKVDDVDEQRALLVAEERLLAKLIPGGILSLKRGDILVVKVSHDVPAEQYKHLRDQLGKLIGDKMDAGNVTMLLVTDDMDFAVIRPPTPIEEEEDRHA